MNMEHHLRNMIWIVCGLALIQCSTGCKRDNKSKKGADEGRIAHLHVRLDDQNSWFPITDIASIADFENMLNALSPTADVARQPNYAKIKGYLYTRNTEKKERKYTLKDDGSLRIEHLEVMLNEQQYNFLLGLIDQAKSIDDTSDDNHNDVGDAHDHP